MELCWKYNFGNCMSEMKKQKSVIYAFPVYTDKGVRLYFSKERETDAPVDIIEDNYWFLQENKKELNRLVNRLREETNQYLSDRSDSLSYIRKMLDTYERSKATHYYITSEGKLYRAQNHKKHTLYYDDKDRFLFSKEDLYQRYYYVGHFSYDKYIVFSVTDKASEMYSLYYTTVEEYKKGEAVLVSNGVVDSSVGVNVINHGDYIVYLKYKEPFDNFKLDSIYLFDIKANKSHKMKFCSDAYFGYSFAVSACGNYVLVFYQDSSSSTSKNKQYVDVFTWSGELLHTFQFDDKMGFVDVYDRYVFYTHDKNDGKALKTADWHRNPDKIFENYDREIDVAEYQNFKVLKNGMLLAFKKKKNAFCIDVYDDSLLCIDNILVRARHLPSIEDYTKYYPYFLICFYNGLCMNEVIVNTDDSEKRTKSSVLYNIDENDYIVLRGEYNGIEYLGLCRKDKFRKDKSENIVVLNIYGGYCIDNISNVFSRFDLFLADHGIISMYANIRSSATHCEDGIKLNKRNSINDTLSFTEYIRTKMARNVILYGGSAGGIAIAGALNEKPEWFAGAVMEVPFVDVLSQVIEDRENLEAEHIGDIRDPAVYFYVKSYCPYHNISADKKYPPIFMIAGIKDERVGIQYVLKYYLKMKQQAKANVRLIIDDYGHFDPINDEKYMPREVLVLDYILSLVKGI